jgi:hypothetical protein
MVVDIHLSRHATFVVDIQVKADATVNQKNNPRCTSMHPSHSGTALAPAEHPCRRIASGNQHQATAIKRSNNSSDFVPLLAHLLKPRSCAPPKSGSEVTTPLLQGRSKITPPPANMEAPPYVPYSLISPKKSNAHTPQQVHHLILRPDRDHLLRPLLHHPLQHRLLRRRARLALPPRQLLHCSKPYCPRYAIRVPGWYAWARS